MVWGERFIRKSLCSPVLACEDDTQIVRADRHTEGQGVTAHPVKNCSGQFFRTRASHQGVKTHYK